MSAIDFTPSETMKAAQRAILQTYLTNHREITTISARDELGICHPAGRVCELRKAGWLIETHRGWAYDSLGRKHTNAVYVLVGSPC